MNKSIIYKATEDKDIQEDLRKLEVLQKELKDLQKEQCEDCISRQAVIELCEGWWLGHTKEDDFATEVRALPSVNPTGHWIPVSERLPEDSGEYFVTVIDEDDETYRHTGISWYAHPKDYDIEEGDWRELMIDEKVIAWMPLPESYKAESEET